MLTEDVIRPSSREKLSEAATSISLDLGIVIALKDGGRSV
jgi:hypothetical protein